MASKKHSDFTPQPQKARPVKDILIELLRDQLAAADLRAKELLRQLAAKDDQIRMVLEERFFKPVIARTEADARVSTPFDTASIVDSTVFPTKGDQEAIEKADLAVKEAQDRLLEELRALEAEHAADHEEEAAVQEEIHVEVVSNA
jgi:hypothetical protein